MAWTDPSPFKIKYLGVNTGFGATGEWIVYGEHINKLINVIVLSVAVLKQLILEILEKYS